MDSLRISEEAFSKDVAGMLTLAESGVEITIERDRKPIAVLSPAVPVGRTISECIARLSADSGGTIDDEFGADIEYAINAHRETPLKW